MSKTLFARLAVTNIKKNKNTYIPYMITCIVCIAMTYMMFFITYNKGMTEVPGGGSIPLILLMGIFVICIFSFIFLLYSNSFLMKRRQKELGLYNVLGLEKIHISKMLLLETVLTALISMAAGLAVGILGSKLALLLLFKLVHTPAVFGFYVSVRGIIFCIVIFGAVFFITLLNNMRRVHLSRPIELLRGSNVGEREPKAKWLSALIGFLCLGRGYYIAVTTKSPMEALGMFFMAVLLVMAGTYLVFTAGSIAVLKIMRWKKGFYYKLKNFTSISGMIYRMKQNAVGLASICILSTGVLLMLSATVCLNFGMEDVVHTRYPYDANVDVRKITLEEGEKARDVFSDFIEKENIPCESRASNLSMATVCLYENDTISLGRPENTANTGIQVLCVIPESDYLRSHGDAQKLSEGEIYIYNNGKTGQERLSVGGVSYSVKEWLKDLPYEGKTQNDITETIYIVAADKDFQVLYDVLAEVRGDGTGNLVFSLGLDIEGTKEEKISWGRRLSDVGKDFGETELATPEAYVMTELREENYADFYALYGGLLFLGIFLGGLFLMGAAMIIYYKQMSEGYEDRERFEIMQKVGMSHREVKSSIRRQILMVFFLPLLTAVLHIAMAFPLVQRLLAMLQMMNMELSILCTAGTILIFAVVYGIIYAVTAKSYYKIVEREA